ncbi:hypothetical protein QQS21_011724 [Conoideocrella luteorostrata]|uniref:F-box domain-containing protein n=1 Tax=Conoideocrella luteorostrata TaxID=1105319 RepID=A0AAJ0FN37_9HYPO|nr:hypothetical protein QQS21_011724 [Conoideocrella luteorostrata]
MASPPVTQPQAGQIHASWLDLPLEMRIEILYLMSQDSQHHRLSLYAKVCSEWQYFLETITFRHLLVDSTALEDSFGIRPFNELVRLTGYLLLLAMSDALKKPVRLAGFEPFQ